VDNAVEDCGEDTHADDFYRFHRISICAR
jgi:hypothetical protein